LVAREYAALRLPRSPARRAKGNSIAPCPSGSVWPLVSSRAVPSTCCQRNPPTVPASISPLISHRAQPPWAPIPCKQSQLSDCPASPRSPMIPPTCLCTAVNSVFSRTMLCRETRRPVIISLGTVALVDSGNSMTEGAPHMTGFSTGFHLKF
jgi:hypothetical protein